LISASDDGQHAGSLTSGDLRLFAQLRGTPLFAIDLNLVRQQVAAFRAALTDVKIYYSVKTNPLPAVLETLRQLGTSFDVATIHEAELVLSCGAAAEDILYSHPVRSDQEIRHAAPLGLNFYTVDSLEELDRVASYTRSARFLIRLNVKSNASLYDYREKFGVFPGEAQRLLDAALERGLPIAGLAFMVGSPSLSLEPFRDALATVESLLLANYDRLPALRMIDIGGGFPLRYGFGDVPMIDEIGQLVHSFRLRVPSDVRIIAEPGRFIVGPAGVLATTVMRRVPRAAKDWLFVDATTYSGVIERIESGGRLAYPITASTAADAACTTFEVAGRTMDPDDLIGSEVSLPCDVNAGDLLLVQDAGAYSTSFFTTYHSLPHPAVVICDSAYADAVRIEQTSTGLHGIVARREFAAGERVLEISGWSVAHRTGTSFEVERDRHLEPSAFGAYLNHSCDPNCGAVIDEQGALWIVARRAIAADEEVTIDYAMTEFETAEMAKTKCRCGTAACRGRITGFRDLPEATKQAYACFIAPHLVDRRRESQAPARAVAGTSG